MSDTPETDAAAAIITRQSDYGMSGYVSADFARRLERQRNMLLVVLEGIMEWEPRLKDESELKAYESARGAIASVKGAKP